ncbi:hypothetical protein PLESTF_001615000 [Pleodorina starrii]|nr:hypothetical protein PLESTM_001499000 [Pleodorina starrii]GLC75264.1 hypothetical protein PLESTF_001615000 [Pleodorina starrii]
MVALALGDMLRGSNASSSNSSTSSMDRSDTYVPCLSAQGCESMEALQIDLENHMVKQYIGCFDRYDTLTAERTAWQHFVEDQPTSLVAARVWWSHKPAGLPVTLVTQLSIGRLEQLRAQCATWRGPLAAAIYIPLVNAEKQLSFDNIVRLADAIGTVHSLVHSVNGTDYQGCQLRVALMYELFAEPRGAALLRPINSLRNYARLMADTDLIFNVDVGLLPSASISDAFMDPRAVAEYTEACRAGAAYVFPAFETSHCGSADGADYANTVALSGRAELRQGLDKKCVSMFESKYPVFQNATQYARWLNSSVPYRVQYHLHYEPSYMSWRWTTPWFDARYRGYGYNKGVQAAAMNATGATWFVSAHGFLVHRPARNHSGTDEGPTRAPPVKGSDGHGLRDAMFGHLAVLWQAAMTGLNATGKIEVRVESSFGRCMRALPWWQPGWEPVPLPAPPPKRSA